MIASSGDIKLYCEAEGPADGAVLLLVPGQGHQAPDWDDEFVQAFLDAGLRVIRMDNRDSGESTFLDGSVDLIAVATGQSVELPYALSDLATDVEAVLDAFDVQRAHIFGHSMGAMVAQLFAIDHSARVVSLTCMAGSTGSSSVGQAHDGIAELLLARSMPGLTKEQRLAASINASAAWASLDRGVTLDSLKEKILRRAQRNTGSGGSERQLAAVLAAPDRTASLSQLDVPTLVIHGTGDTLVDVSGGHATATAIPDATLLLLDGVRHDIPPAVRAEVASAVIEHIRSACA